MDIIRKSVSGSPTPVVPLSPFHSIVSKAGSAFDGASDGNDQTQNVTYIRKHIATAACTGVKFVYSNWYGPDQTHANFVDNMEVRTSIVIDPANPIQVPMVTVPRGRNVETVEIAVNLSKGQEFWVRTNVKVPLGSRYPWGGGPETGTSGGTMDGNMYEGVVQGDATMVINPILSNKNTKFFGPTAILGRVTDDADKRTIVFFGDSLVNGVGTNNNNGSLWAERSFAYLASRRWNVGIIRIGGNATEMSSASNFVETFRNARWDITSKYGTDVIVAYGANDLKNRTNSQADIDLMKSRFRYIHAFFRAIGLRTHQMLVMPRYEETGYVHGTTTIPESGFEPGPGSLRAIINQWIKDTKVDGLATSVLDLTQAVETGENTNIFKPGMNSDYVHWSFEGATAVAEMLNLTTL